MPLTIVRTVDALRDALQSHRANGKTIGLVPTMGALHHGHLSLVDEIAKHVDIVVVSIFVNPTQFGEGEDFSAYPRTEESDVAKLGTTNAALVYIPDVAQMYPEGDSTRVHVSGISERFEGKERPGHFTGVATVVTRLLMQCMPDAAIFGEKDYQQLAVIRRLVTDLAIPVRILGAPIIREADGLAASSRNMYLDEQGRRIAGQLNVILRALIKAVKTGTPLGTAENDATIALLAAGFTRVDYVTVVDTDTLEPAKKFEKTARVLAVARIGAVRLLDNMAIEKA